MSGIHGIAALARRPAAAADSPGRGSTTHSCRASSASVWHCWRQSHVVGKAGWMWIPHPATSGLKTPHCVAHAGKSGAAQSGPP